MIAHRGFTQRAVMNSVAAFEEAGKRQYWAIETDVRKTKDGVLVCSHDPVVDTLFDGSGKICNMKWEELQKLHYKNGQNGRIPMFIDYLQICHDYGCIPFIETKTDDISDVLEVSRSIFPSERIIISSICFEHLVHVRQLDRNVFVHHIFSDEDKMIKLAQMGNAGVSLNCPIPDEVSKEQIARIHAKGLKVCLRAGDTLKDIKKMTRLGLDYIPTNKITPEDVRRL